MVLSKHSKTNIVIVIFDVSITFIYLGDIDRYSRDDQFANCLNAVKEMKLPAIGDSIYEHHEMKEMLRNVRGDVAVVLPRLDVMGEHKGRGVGNRFLSNMIMVTNQAHVIIDMHKGITSHDYGEWYSHIKTTLGRLTNSRKPTPGHHRKIGKLRPTKPGIVQHWKE